MTSNDFNPKVSKTQSKSKIPNLEDMVRWFLRRYFILLGFGIVIGNLAYFRLIDGVLPELDFVSGFVIALFFTALLFYRRNWSKELEENEIFRDFIFQNFSELQLRKHIQELSIRKGFVYILKDMDVTGWCKIGKSDKIADRIGHFDTTLPFSTKLVHVIESKDCTKLESVLHRHFSEKRMRGEWFSLSEQDIEWLLKMKEG